MSEFQANSPAPPVDRQLERLIADVESKFIAAEDALSELRHAIRGLKSYRPAAELQSGQWAVDVNAQMVRGEAPSGEAAASPRRGPGLEDETVGVPVWPGPRTEEARPGANPPRETGVDSTSEGSWPMARPAPRAVREDEEPGVAESVRPEPDAADRDERNDEMRREEVARVVAERQEGAEVSDESEDEEPAHQEAAGAPVDDDAARRLEVARMVAEMRAGANDGHEPEAVIGEDHGTDEPVPSAQAESIDAEEGETAPDGDDRTRRVDVASMVAQMRAELDSGVSEEAEEAVDPAADDAEVRDEVRRAVDAARAEMAPGYREPAEASPGHSGESRFSFTDWQSSHAEPSGPPVIVIKDSEGRVELARVYETLNQVHCDENAALLNYTPHSVTVGLNIRAAVPEAEALSEAVRTVFGRACQVDSDGVRLTVQIGKDLKGRDSAA